MLRLTAERRSLSKVSGASAPESRITKTSSALHSSAQSVRRSSVAPRVSSSCYRGLVFGLLFSILIIAFVVAAAYLVGYIAVHVPAAVVILGCLVLIGLIVARGTAKS